MKQIIHLRRYALQTMLVLGVLFMFTAPGNAFAQEIFRVNPGQTVEIDRHGVCQRVTNSGGAGVMVPTRQAAAWSSFRSSPPPGVSLSNCAPACGGVSIGGYCWYAGARAQSCTTVCSGRGGVNITGTRNYAGSGGAAGNCYAVAAALGLSNSPGGNLSGGSCTTGNTTIGIGGSPTGLGCMQTENSWFPGFFTIVHCSSPTTTASALGVGNQYNSHVRRVCACSN